MGASVRHSLIENPRAVVVADRYSSAADVCLLQGEAQELLKGVPSRSVQLTVSSPPYNIGKEYESQSSLSDYLATIEPVIVELVRVTRKGGSICWQIGNFVSQGEVFPLDIYFYPLFKRHGLALRNRVVWYFEHGLHATKRLSGRYETLLWFTKGDRYTFNLDAIRVPSKYPGKLNYKGPNKGKPSGNPLGKNPSDVWKTLEADWSGLFWDIPNVKSNHPEKTSHPCQFPIELVERCVLAMTSTGDVVLDPFAGVGSTAIAALMHRRRALCCEREDRYIHIARDRIRAFEEGRLRYRHLGRAKYQPTGRERVSQVPIEWDKKEGA